MYIYYVLVVFCFCSAFPAHVCSILLVNVLFSFFTNTITWNALIFNLLISQTFMFLDSSHTFMFWSSLVAQLVKNRLQCGRPGFKPWVGKIPWRRECLPTSVFWLGEFHGLYSPRDGKDSDTTEWLWLCFRIPMFVLVKSKLSGFFFMV